MAHVKNIMKLLSEKSLLEKELRGGVRRVEGQPLTL